jgi:hypothetical protein
MSDKGGPGYTTVKITRVDWEPPPRHYDRNHGSSKWEYIEEAMASKYTLYVEITPRDYKINKLHDESRKGAYDFQKAKLKLGL